ncbi:MAG: hypothetical protein ACFE8A_03505 [Candidatus Hodarchaeota archaeon]
MLVSLLIPPITYRSTIILWKRIGFSNLIRAIIVLLGASFIPGASIYNIFFSNTNLDKRLNLNSSIIKLTLYPILSFAFIGISTLILDQINLHKDHFLLALIIIIYNLLSIDLIIQKTRNEVFFQKINKIEVSNNLFIILLMAIGFIFISLAVLLANPYLTLSDSWAGVSPSKFIGSDNTSPIARGEDFLFYPIFWCYVIFGFSILGGIPFVNMNVLFFPFTYLFVTSVFILMKSILINFKEKLAVSSTIVMITFSGLFYIISFSTISSLSFVCLIYIIYKSYSIILFILSLAIFILISKTRNMNEEKRKFNFILNLQESKIIYLSAFLLSLSFLSYMIPFLMGFLMIILYCMVTEKKIINFQILSFFILLTTITLIVFDLVMSTYLSLSIFNMIQWIFQSQVFAYLILIIPPNIIVYTLFIIIFFASILNWYIYKKKFINGEKKFFKFNFDVIKTFKICLLIFSIFLIIEVISILLGEIFSNNKLYEKYMFFNYLHEIFINIGYVGIVAVYLSFFCFKMNKSLFRLMFTWTFFVIIFGSLLIYLNWYQTLAIKTNTIDSENFRMMYFWFNRIWVFSVIPFSILFTLGISKFIKIIKNKDRFKKLFLGKNRRIFTKYLSFSLFIFLFLSNFFIFSMRASDIENKISEDEIEMFSWMSDNIPEDSKILMENDFVLKIGTLLLASSYYIILNDVFESRANPTERNEEISDLKDDKIKYFLISEDYFEDQNNRTVFVKNYLIPRLYNETKKEIGDLTLYYAPFFD